MSSLSEILTGILAVAALIFMIALMDPSSGSVSVKAKTPNQPTTSQRL